MEEARAATARLKGVCVCVCVCLCIEVCTLPTAPKTPSPTHARAHTRTPHTHTHTHTHKHAHTVLEQTTGEVDALQATIRGLKQDVATKAALITRLRQQSESADKVRVFLCVRVCVSVRVCACV